MICWWLPAFRIRALCLCRFPHRFAAVGDGRQATWAELGERLRRRVRRSFDPAACARRCVRLFETLQAWNRRDRRTSR